MTKMEKATHFSRTSRRSLLKTFDTLDRRVDRRGLMDGLDSIEQQAFSLVLSKARQTFDVNREVGDQKMLFKYSGKVSGDTITGKIVFGREKPLPHDWEATRVKE